MERLSFSKLELLMLELYKGMFTETLKAELGELKKIGGFGGYDHPTQKRIETIERILAQRGE